jgi:sec-independent protein translocase protein TatB
MIDIGLTKLALIGVVALVVIGPERLPKVARMAGTLFGRAQRYINDVKSEVSREIELEELRKMRTDVEQAASEVSSGFNKSMSDTESQLNDAWNSGDASTYDSTSTAGDSWKRTPNADLLAIKAKAFRRKKLARTTAVPTWYKQHNGRKTRVISASARVARYRPISAGKSAGFF